MITPWLYIFSSIILQALPFWLPNTFWWLIFLFPLPLLYCATYYPLRARHGFVWGYFLFGTQLYGIMYGLLNMSKGSFWLRISPCILVPLYGACMGALLFGTTHYLLNKLNLHKKWHRLVAYSLMFFSFILIIDYISLLPFGRCEGYLLMHPLIPLMQFPPLVRLLSWCGKLGLTLLLVITWISFAASMVYKNKFTLLFCASTLLWWSAQSVIPLRTESVPTWVNTITPLPAIFVANHNATELAEIIAQECRTIIAKKPATRTIVMPESSLYCSSFALPAITELFDAEHIGKPINFIAGGFKWEGTQYHNTLYWIYNGVLQNCYYKRHAMALTERIPAIMPNTYMRNLFFTDMPPIALADNPHPVITLAEEVKLVPYICSELFFNETADDAYITYPILALCNDRHYPPYIAKLMQLGACFKAVQWQRPIVYIAFVYQTYCDKYGFSYPLL